MENFKIAGNSGLAQRFAERIALPLRRVKVRIVGGLRQILPEGLIPILNAGMRIALNAPGLRTIALPLNFYMHEIERVPPSLIPTLAMYS